MSMEGRSVVEAVLISHPTPSYLNHCLCQQWPPLVTLCPPVTYSSHRWGWAERSSVSHEVTGSYVGTIG